MDKKHPSSKACIQHGEGGQIAQCVEPGMANNLVASGFHNDGKRAGSFHFVCALLVGFLVTSQSSESQMGRDVRGYRRLQGQAVACRVGAN
jgi:hypothetical protein